MARSRAAAHEGSAGEQPQSRRAQRVTDIAHTPQAGLTPPNSAGIGVHRAAQLQRALGNSAVRRVVAGSAPQGPQRLWDLTEFAKRTYQSRFTQKSSAQKAVEAMLATYNATPLVNKKRTAAHASLLSQMAASAQLWLDDHTVTDEEGTSEDPARANRMQGFKDFITNVNAELELAKTDLGSAYSPEITEEHEAYVKLRDHYKGSADSLFVKAAGLINKAVSNPGDAASLEIEFEIPVEPTGVGFIGGRLSVEAEKGDDSMLKVRTEMAVTGGAKIGIAKVKAEVGGYIEAQAATAADAMNLYSYGLYRRFRESDSIPSEMTNYLWGGQASKHGKKKAEAWSRDLETRLFGMMPDPDPNDVKYKGLPQVVKKRKLAEDQEVVDAQRERVKNTYIETGGLVAGKGEVGLEGIAELQLGITYTKGTKITAESLQATKGGAGKKNRESIIGGQKTVGEATSNVTVAMEAEVGPLTGGLEISLSGEDREIEFTIGGKIPASAMDGVIAYLADIAVSGIKLYRTVKANESKTESLAPLMAFGMMQAKLVGTPVAGVIAKKGPMGLVGDVGLEFVANIAREDGVWTGSLELRHVSSFDTEIPIGLKVELEKSSRLMKWTYSGGAWVAS